MANPQSSTRTENHFYTDDASKIIYYGPNSPDQDLGLVFLGSSDNPKPASAATAMLKGQKGWKIRKLEA